MTVLIHQSNANIDGPTAETVPILEANHTATKTLSAQEKEVDISYLRTIVNTGEYNVNIRNQSIKFLGRPIQNFRGQKHSIGVTSSGQLLYIKETTRRRTKKTSAEIKGLESIANRIKLQELLEELDRLQENQKKMQVILKSYII